MKAFWKLLAFLSVDTIFTSQEVWFLTPQVLCNKYSVDQNSWRSFPYWPLLPAILKPGSGVLEAIGRKHFVHIQKSCYSQHCSYAVSKPESTFLTPHYFCSVLGPLIQKASEDPRNWLGTKPSIKPTNFAVVWDAAHRRIWLFTELLLAYAAGLYLPPPFLISLKFPSPTFHPVSYMLLVYPASQRSFE